MLKAIIVILILAILVSLFSGFVFLMKDDGKSMRVVNSLKLRVGLSALLILVVVIGIYTGNLTVNPSPAAGL